MTDGGYPAIHPPLPTVVSNPGAPVATTLRFMAITFSNDDSTTVAAIDDFVSSVGLQPYWGLATGEYGVGTPTVASPVHLAETATGTIDDMAIESWLTTKLTTTGSPLGTPDSSTLYLIFYPSAATITEGGGTQCTAFGGYHYEISVNGAPVMYAVLPRCTTCGPGASPIDSLTGATSHEMIEAATDPFPVSNPAYAGPDQSYAVWTMLLYGEVGDMCVFDPAAFYTPSTYNHMVQRTWSNVAAAKGADPCVPALPNENFFFAVPDLRDPVHYNMPSFGISGTTAGLKVPIGQSKQLKVYVYSQGPTQPITVFAQGYPSSGTLTITPASATGVNGDVLTFNVTHNSDDATYGGAPFVVGVQLGSTDHYYLGYVGD